ncbi:hypothetical protein FD21_GL000348 [Liquorilactobacillus vini DSM 20605]|uniref:YdbS-like PH domain-containing protein n=2 Tax=Liquorilactobacillus vini TaxID=238015 RepID=A0A0R2CCI5_9LACO|nr:hypothetical protein FD21_GL000348 [Liquorilactobacillus vini DSM 20605]
MPYNRIQAIQRRAWFLFKPFGIIGLIVETAGTTAENVKLLAVKKIVYDHLARLRQAENSQAQSTDQPSYQPQFKVATRDIWRFSLTDQSAFMMLLALVAFFDSFKGWLPKNWLASRLEAVILSGFVSLLLGGLCLGGLVILAALLKNYACYYHFTVRRQNDDLLVERGLFTRNTLTIPLRRIQAIQIKQNFLRAWLKLTSVELILAAGMIGGQLLYLKKVSRFSLKTLIVPQNKVQCQQVRTTWWLMTRRLGHIGWQIKKGMEMDEIQLKYLSLAACRSLKNIYGKQS